MIGAVIMLARHEGILLDPVYSGKGMAGMIDLVRTGFFKNGEMLFSSIQADLRPCSPTVNNTAAEASQRKLRVAHKKRQPKSI